jgi:hypothetical protein
LWLKKRPQWLNRIAGGPAAAYISGMKPILLMIFSLFSLVTAQPSLAQTPPARLDPSMVSFFSGEWKGEGAFANGRPIAASLTFRLSLDSAWLVSDHADQPPNDYKATSYWGVDAATGQFVAIIFDNFHGHRSFASSGWAAGRLVLTTQSFAAGAGTYFEHFIYERQSDTQFRMTYETSRDGIAWQMGDSLLFTKRRPS